MQADKKWNRETGIQANLQKRHRLGAPAAWRLTAGALMLVLALSGCGGRKTQTEASDMAATGTNTFGMEDPGSAATEAGQAVYEISISLEGGSGRATVTSPALLTEGEGTVRLRLEWSSANYDYMIVDGKRYEPVDPEKHTNSVFEIELPGSAKELPESLSVTADTTAMGAPHEISYTLHLDRDSLKAGQSASEPRSAKRVQEGTSASGSANSVSAGDERTDGGSENGAAESKTGSGGQSGPAQSLSPSLVYDHSMPLDYATEFSVDYYKDGFTLISISDGSRYLLCEQGRKAPEELAAGITVLELPADHIYLAASAVMDMFEAAGATDHIVLSGIKEEDWVSKEAKAAMAAGKIQYAGKYNTPDYERILSAGCTLAIESTMILHSPDVKEKLESFGIPVLVDRSSYEAHPLGRTEWVKLYGVLTGTSDAADAAFREQKQHLMSLQQAQNAARTEEQGPTVVFFYITSNGTVVVRKPGDYVANMLELAGGTYLFQELRTKDSGSTSVNMQMEEFYAKAKDADFLIYNSTIDGVLSSISDLTAKSPFLKDFKAVKSGQVYCTTQNVYQGSMSAGSMTEAFYKMFTAKEKSYEDSGYLFRLRQ